MTEYDRWLTSGDPHDEDCYVTCTNDECDAVDEVQTVRCRVEYGMVAEYDAMCRVCGEETLEGAQA